MKLILKKVASINIESEIDLSKKIIVFVGLNSSGKSYVSQLIWAIFNHSNLIKELNYELKIENSSIDLKESNIKAIFKEFSNELKKVVSKIFNFKLNLDFEINVDYQEYLNLFISDINFSKNRDNSKIDIISEDKNINNKIIFSIIENFINYNTTYIPSTREFLPQYYKALQPIIESSNSSQTLPIKNIINMMISNLQNPMETEITKELENILGGEIIKESDELFFEPKEGEKIPMFLSSSMTNQLTLLYFYFKFWLKNKNNFLLIDEPELNLHPKIKIKITEILLKFAQNNKLLLATHSSVIARVFINYILMDLSKQKGLDIKKLIDEEELKIDNNINFSKDDIKIYYFGDGSVKEYKINGFGMHFGTFTEVDEELNLIEDTFFESLR